MSGEAAASRNFWSKMMSLFGLDENLDAEEEEGGRQLGPALDRERGRVLVSLPGGSRGRGGKPQVAEPMARYRAEGISLFRPRVFEEVQEMVDRLKSRGPIVVNLDRAERELAQRMLTFLSGALYAIEGEMYELGPGVYLVSPNSVHVSDQRGDAR